MAYFQPTGDDRLPVVYNVNFPVGANSPNRRDDVYLVQWLLHHVYAEHPSFNTPDGSDIAIDGWYGPQTLQWIKMFQADVRKIGQSCALDGRVDRLRPTGNPNTGFYTIAYLNYFFGSVNPAAFSTPASDPTCPQPLLSALSTNTGDDGPYQPRPVPATAGL